MSQTLWEKLPLSFRSKVNPLATGCWIWTASLDSSGYGNFYYKQRFYRAHRFMLLCIGLALQPGLTVDHLCGERRCVRPDHLEQVSHRENVRRSNSPFGLKARSATCVRGHPLSGKNLSVRDNGTRQCKECHRMSAKASYARRFL